MLNPTPVTLRGRRAAEAIMVDACTITRPTSTPTNPEMGTVVVTTATIYTGKCRVSIAVKNARPFVVGEAQLFLIRVQLQLPVTAVNVAIDDRVLLTASTLDPELVGKTFVVRELAHGTHITSRRLQMQEIAS